MNQRMIPPWTIWPNGPKRGYARLLFALGVVLVGCAAPPGLNVSGGPAAEQPRESAPRRITAAVNSEPVVLDRRVSATSVSPPGSNVLEMLVNSGLVNEDEEGILRAKLAEAIPSLENGLWKVFPDGQMETTWKIREDARWHDGSPFTAEDVVFTARLGQDRELAVFRHAGYDFVESIAAPDSRTVILRWTRPYIDAHALFVRLIPRHLLEKAYLEDKTTFTQLPYWSEQFVGTGPFKLHEWARGSHAVLQAFDQYVFGRPKIDEIVVRFLLDPTALIANILAGEIDLTLGKGLTLEQGLQVREQWRAGRVDLAPANWLVYFPQFINPNPPVVANGQFRRALMHALDRQQLVDTLMAGQTVIGHSFLNPNQSQYRDIEARLIRYDHDPRRAMQLIEGLGYSKGPDGMYRDAADQKLSVELRTVVTVELNQKVVLSSADYLQRIGIGVEPNLVPQQRLREQEYIAQFPGFLMYRNPNDVAGLAALHSSRTSLPENSFRVTGNNSRYTNPEFDALIERYFATIPTQERVQALGEIIYHISEQLNLMGLFYDQQPTMVSNRTLNAGVTKKVNEPQAWTAHLWEVR